MDNEQIITEFYNFCVGESDEKDLAGIASFAVAEYGATVQFDLENVNAGDDDWPSNLHDELGLKISDNGVPYLMAMAGGDWEVPVVFIVYKNGSELATFVPWDGNCFDKVYGEAYEADYVQDEEYFVPMMLVAINSFLNVISREETVAVPESYYKELLRKEAWLDCLTAAGVDNWGGIEFAHELMDQPEEDVE